ncbi:MAG: deoxyguanosinetriphosphate triphosphohydrolase [Gammaproteobacteria bacterium]
MTLAAYAVTAASSRGRCIPEPPPTWRDEFQRDRDRVVHSSAFRRLEYKTQVFVNHEGDMFRTRLTHSLEVTQIARTVARALSVNEDLTEAITLAHDLGHTPFGHAGQTALDEAMRPFGGFEHNLHSLRVVDRLETRYAEFDGLNLLFETREGILKHCRPERARELGAVAQRFLDGQQATVEAQIANVADEIAYNHHDIDDGLRSGILAFDAIAAHPVFGRALAESRARAADLGGKRLVYTAIRSMLGLFANDLIDGSRRRLEAAGCATVEDVRALAQPVVALSPDVLEHHLSLKRLLHRELYSDPRVREFTQAGARTIADLFARFMDTPALLPGERRPSPGADEASRARAVADYIAGMTDRFAIAEHRRLVGHDYWPERRGAR